jgi:hypothetical protein
VIVDFLKGESGLSCWEKEFSSLSNFMGELGEYSKSDCLFRLLRDGDKIESFDFNFCIFCTSSLDGE